MKLWNKKTRKIVKFFEKYDSKLEKETDKAINKLWARAPLNSRDKRLLNRIIKKLLTKH